MHRFLPLALASSLACAQPAPLALEQARELDLDGLRGLGPATTQRVLQERERMPFRDWADLMARVPGIGPGKAQDLSAQGLRVQGLAYTAPPKPGAKPGSKPTPQPQLKSQGAAQPTR